MSAAFISPDSMSYLASDAATSVNLAWKGYRDETVRTGLQRGTEFCEILLRGITERRAKTQFFSPRSLAAEGFVGWVMKVDDLRTELEPARLDRIQKTLTTMRSRVEKPAEKTRRLTQDDARELYEFFEKVSRALSHHSALMRRLGRRRAGA